MTLLLAALLAAPASASDPIEAPKTLPDDAIVIDLGGAVRGADAPRPSFTPLPRVPVNLDVVEADLAGVLRLMATLGDLNIVLADGVKGQVTVQVVDRPWDETLGAVLSAAGLTGVRVGERLIVVEPGGT